MCTDIAPLFISSKNKAKQPLKCSSEVSSNDSNLSRNSRSDYSGGSNLSRNSHSDYFSKSSSSRSFGAPKSKLVGSFHEDYHNLCRGKRQPVNFFKLNPASSKFELKLFADKIKFSDWELIINALRGDTTLLSITIQNRRVGILKLGNFDEIDTREKAQRFDRVPVILTKFLMLQLTGGLAQCLGRTEALNDLHLEALPLRTDCIAALCKGLAKCTSLTRLALPYCLIGDDAFAVLCRTLKHLPDLKVLDLTCCGLTHVGIESLADVIKFQQLWRAGECWEQCLRYRKPDPEAISGLRRVTLSHNLIGDAGAVKIIDALADDNFIKAVDLQNCQLTERIGPRLLELIEANNQLLIFDVRLNQLSEEWVRQILGQLQIGRVRSEQWRWIRAEVSPNNVWKSGSKLRKTSSGAGSVSSVSSTNLTRQTSGSSVRGSSSGVGSRGSKSSTNSTRQISLNIGTGKTVQLISALSDVLVSGVNVTECTAATNRQTLSGVSSFSTKSFANSTQQTSNIGAGSDVRLISGQPRISISGSKVPACSASLEQETDRVSEPKTQSCVPNATGVKLDHFLTLASVAGRPHESLGLGPVLVYQPCPDCGCGSAQWARKRSGAKLGTDCGCGPPQWTGNQNSKNVSFSVSGCAGVCPGAGSGEGDKNAKEAACSRCSGNQRQQSAVSGAKIDTDRNGMQQSETDLKFGKLSQATRQTSLKETTSNADLFSGSDESILRAVFLGRNRTKKSTTESSDSSFTVGSSTNSSHSSDSSNSMDTGASSRATLIRLLLKPHSLTSNSQLQAPSCQRFSSRLARSSGLLKATS